MLPLPPMPHGALPPLTLKCGRLMCGSLRFTPRMMELILLTAFDTASLAALMGVMIAVLTALNTALTRARTLEMAPMMPVTMPLAFSTAMVLMPSQTVLTVVWIFVIVVVTLFLRPSHAPVTNSMAPLTAFEMPSLMAFQTSTTFARASSFVARNATMAPTTAAMMVMGPPSAVVTTAMRPGTLPTMAMAAPAVLMKPVTAPTMPVMTPTILTAPSTPAMSGRSGATTGAMAPTAVTTAPMAVATTGATVSTALPMLSNASLSGPPTSDGSADSAESSMPGSAAPSASNARWASPVRFSTRPPSRSPVLALMVPNTASMRPSTDA